MVPIPLIFLINEIPVNLGVGGAADIKLAVRWDSSISGGECSKIESAHSSGQNTEPFITYNEIINLYLKSSFE